MTQQQVTDAITKRLKRCGKTVMLRTYQNWEARGDQAIPAPAADAMLAEILDRRARESVLYQE